MMNTQQFIEAVSAKVLGFIKTLFYNKEEIDTKLENVEVNTSTLLDKETYASKINSDSVKKADISSNIEGYDTSGEFTYYGKNKNGEIGFHPFPIGDNGEINNFQSVKLNVKTNDNIYIELLNENTNNDLIIQGYEFQEGEQNISSTIKIFNNAESANFNYNEENIDFSNGMHIKNKYTISNSLDNTSGFYESEIINKSDFVNLVGIGVDK